MSPSGLVLTNHRCARECISRLSSAQQNYVGMAAVSASKDRMIESASVVEPKASALACPRCQVAVSVEAHLAPSSDGMRLREAVVKCPRCGQRRSIWFRLVGPSLN